MIGRWVGIPLVSPSGGLGYFPGLDDRNLLPWPLNFVMLERAPTPLFNLLIHFHMTLPFPTKSECERHYWYDLCSKHMSFQETIVTK